MAEIYRWQVQGPDGQELTGDLPVAEFPTQGDAEAWLTQEWGVLADAGASAVTLMCENEVVYGPMSLEPPQ